MIIACRLDRLRNLAGIPVWCTSRCSVLGAGACSPKA